MTFRCPLRFKSCKSSAHGFYGCLSGARVFTRITESRRTRDAPESRRTATCKQVNCQSQKAVNGALHAIAMAVPYSVATVLKNILVMHFQPQKDAKNIYSVVILPT